MKIGYSAWGFVGDGVLDSPDGGRLTRALMIEHILNDDHEVVWLQKNRDVDEHGEPLFDTNRIDEHKTEQRKTLCRLQYDTQYPEIDVLFLEWRWMLIGRNCRVEKDDPAYTPDLDRQKDLLAHYNQKRVKIVIWDKDGTVSHGDELALMRGGAADIKIVSPALYPRSYTGHFEKETLLFPCDLNKIRGTRVNSEFKYLIGYVGSQYDRDEQVYKYVNPFAIKYPHNTVFAGNWTKYPEKLERNIINFPGISFHDRILPKDMWKFYKNSLSCVLLCRPSYSIQGHITQRIHEVASHGVIGIGLHEQRGIEKFILEDNVIKDAYDLIQRIEHLLELSIEKRQTILDEQIELLQPFDIKNVIIKFRGIIS